MRACVSAWRVVTCKLYVESSELCVVTCKLCFVSNESSELCLFDLRVVFSESCKLCGNTS